MFQIFLQNFKSSIQKLGVIRLIPFHLVVVVDDQTAVAVDVGGRCRRVSVKELALAERQGPSSGGVEEPNLASCAAVEDYEP